MWPDQVSNPGPLAGDVVMTSMISAGHMLSDIFDICQGIYHVWCTVFTRL